MTDPTKRLRSQEAGFTLIELLIVIIILGILAGIALLNVDSFRTRAAEACEETNAAIDDVAVAAGKAGVTNVYEREGDCSGAGGGASATFTANLEQSWTASAAPFAPTLNAPPTAGNLLVAVVGVRSSAAFDDVAPPDPTATGGWTFQGRAGFQLDNFDRRHIAVFTKVAAGGDTLSITWTDAGTITGIVREYSRSAGTWANVVNFAPTNGVSAATGSPFALGGATGFTGSGLQIAGVVGRDGPDASNALAGLGSVQTHLANGIAVVTGSATVSGTGPHATSLSWAGGTSFRVSGFVIVVR